MKFNFKTLLFHCFSAFLFIALLSSATISNAQQIDLSEEILQIESRISVMEASDTTVSAAPVKWHLLHMLQVINAVYDEALASNPDQYDSKSNIQCFYVSTFQKIPRGKVTAPDRVNPSFEISEGEISSELAKTREKLANWDSLEEDSYFHHFMLLNLNKRKMKKFLRVHTRHHLKIVSDILEKKPA